MDGPANCDVCGVPLDAHGGNCTTELLKRARADNERLRAAIREAKTVVGFVLGWWPGLEDGIRERGDDEALAENKVYLAAKRFRALTPEGESREAKMERLGVTERDLHGTMPEKL